MLAFDDIHFNYTMSSQLKFHSIKKQPDFTFCDIPKRKNHQEHYENENPLGLSQPPWSKNIPSNTMVEGRKELMDMVNDLPESWFELSLKDMVKKEPDDLGLVIGDKVDMKPELKGKKKGAKRGPISRSTWRFVENRSNISSRSYKDSRRTTAATKNRYAEGTLKHGCWFKSTNQKWCIFF
ncbi:hypothetical protein L1987_23643 [Smallanthus sonchifolius]|uniref:Uncharacterized protein n=1 Tax=Smallanthus sonchifolius TaxID=185202 RepID=A0ACB9IIG8_9ASTR|nr:hypothetical protein L1987_23643 [Smallanthus sonchifolius]